MMNDNNAVKESSWSLGRRREDETTRWRAAETLRALWLELRRFLSIRSRCHRERQRSEVQIRWYCTSAIMAGTGAEFPCTLFVTIIPVHRCYGVLTFK